VIAVWTCAIDADASGVSSNDEKSFEVLSPSAFQ